MTTGEKVPVSLDALDGFRDIAARNGTWRAWSDIAMDWATLSQEEIGRLRVERDRLADELRQLHENWKESVSVVIDKVSELDAVTAERDRYKAQRDRLIGELDRALTRAVDLGVERDRLAAALRRIADGDECGALSGDECSDIASAAPAGMWPKG